MQVQLFFYFLTIFFTKPPIHNFISSKDIITAIETGTLYCCLMSLDLLQLFSQISRLRMSGRRTHKESLLNEK